MMVSERSLAAIERQRRCEGGRIALGKDILTGVSV